jgi:superfamily II DNA/RNA helicase
MRFDEFDLNDQLLEAISYMGFEKASPVQEKAIPEILNNRDLIAFAQTGTGKTAAFVLPILNKIAENPDSGINTLIIVPTRELAIQIEQQIQGFSYFLPVNSIAIYGGGDGADYSAEAKALKKHVDIIVATPGRLISHLNIGKINFENLKHLVLDEADRMLDMGFHDDIMRIVSYLPKKRETMMFSATMPPKIKKLAQSILYHPVEISIELSKPAEGVVQEAYFVHDEQKNPLITHILSNRPEFTSVLVFTSTKVKVNKIVSGLRGKGYRVEGISSDLDQKRREEVLSEFRSHKARVLVATDVLSRGIDIKDINLIINYDVPHDAEDYVHRVGRTARAETTGVAVTLINKTELRKFLRIEALIGKEVPKMSLPPELGDQPVMDPHQHAPADKRFKPRRKNYGPRKGGSDNRKPQQN